MRELIGFWLACIALVVVVALMSGCDGSSSYQVNLIGGYAVQLETLPDGTRCAVVNASHGAGISCDWEARR